jgi:hypothetical protein
VLIAASSRRKAGLCRRRGQLANFACYRWFYTLTSGGLWRARANAPAALPRFRGYHTVLNRKGRPACTSVRCRPNTCDEIRIEHRNPRHRSLCSSRSF